MKWSWFEILEAVLKEVRLPAAVIETVHKLGKNELDRIRVENDMDALKALPGIADKRAVVILRQLDKMTRCVRHPNKAQSRDKAVGFNVRTYEADTLWAFVMDIIKALKAYRYDKNKPEERAAAAELLDKLREKVFTNRPLAVNKYDGRVTRLSRFTLSDVAGIDYDSKIPVKEFIVIEHGIQELFMFDWHLFGNEVKEALKKREEFQQKVEFQFGYYGTVVVDATDKLHYGGIAASASHQKQEKVLMGEKSMLTAHSKFLWWGKGLKDFYGTAMSGSAYWKCRANEIRPTMKPFVTKTGDYITHKDILVVKDIKKVYHIINARVFGSKDGRCYHDGPADEPVILGDGAMLFIVEVNTNGQATLPGFKAMGVNSVSALKKMCEKHGLKLEDVLNLEVEGIDGKMHRIGDYKAVCGDGCWKFDKVFDNYQQYVDWLTEMGKMYPGIDRLYLLRQSEEIEGEEKYRYFTRTLLQQFMWLSEAEKKKLTAKAVSSLKRDKTFSGAVSKMAAMWKDPEDKTGAEKIFEAYPGLVNNNNIQEYIKASWMRRQTRAASGKFRTEGQYPYIMQDPVALLEVWLLGMDPNDPELGVLNGDEISCAEVPDGKELACVRFPANFQTVKVMTNRVNEAFDDCAEVAVLSIHSDILIRQDGDVDGDEMCVLYSKLVVEMTKRMNAVFNPPVVLFAHGDSNKPSSFGNYEGFIRETYSALWRAKRYDQVGIYANLATACAYLASIAYVQSGFKADDREVQLRLLQMSAASTGAILAIDQVKGNDTDARLIDWLESIRKDVAKAISGIVRPSFVAEIPEAIQGDARKEMEKIADLKARAVKYPHVHYYVMKAKNGTMSFDSCLPCDVRNICDNVEAWILDQTGKYEFDYEGTWFDVDECVRLFTDTRVSKIWKTVKTASVPKESLALLQNNRFNRKNDADTPIISRMMNGDKVGQKDLLVMMYRNKCSMSYHMEGANLAEKEAEYYGVCRQILFAQADNADYTCHRAENGVEAGYVLTSEERHAVVVNAAVIDALELGEKGNGIQKDQKGGYAMFVLNVFAPDILENIKRNKEAEQVCDLGFLLEDLVLDCTIDLLSDEDDLYEDTPVVTAQPEEPMFFENIDFVPVYGDCVDEFMESMA